MRRHLLVEKVASDIIFMELFAKKKFIEIKVFCFEYFKNSRFPLTFFLSLNFHDANLSKIQTSIDMNRISLKLSKRFSEKYSLKPESAKKIFS